MKNKMILLGVILSFSLNMEAQISCESLVDSCVTWYKEKALRGRVYKTFPYSYKGGKAKSDGDVDLKVSIVTACGESFHNIDLFICFDSEDKVKACLFQLSFEGNTLNESYLADIGVMQSQIMKKYGSTNMNKTYSRDGKITTGWEYSIDGWLKSSFFLSKLWGMTISYLNWNIGGTLKL